MSKKNLALLVGFSAALLGIGFFVSTSYLQTLSMPESESSTEEIVVDVNYPPVAELAPAVTNARPTSLPSDSLTATPSKAPALPPSPPPKPTVTPPPLNHSDNHLKSTLATLEHGPEIVSLLVNDEILRKIVRAVYGLSEGKVVQQFRPIHSPKGIFQAKPISTKLTEDGQVLYRIARENEQRYANFIAVLAMLNNDSAIKIYQFYLPTLNSAYAELGLKEGDFHSILIKAIDVVLDSPPVDEALVLTRPTVAYKFHNPELEKLSAVQKLLLRMGTENRESLKLELKRLREKLENF